MRGDGTSRLALRDSPELGRSAAVYAEYHHGYERQQFITWDRRHHPVERRRDEVSCCFFFNWRREREGEPLTDVVIGRNLSCGCVGG